MSTKMVGQRAGQRQLWVCGIALALLLTAGAVFTPAAAKQVKPAAVFVLGDSYSDTGNRNRSDPLTNQSWKYPYGITWKAGRFSDGRVSTDYLVELFGLPPLKTYASITRSTPPGELRQGVNFAVGGAGAFPVSGPFPTLSQQVEQLKEVVRKYPNLFSPAKSVVLMSCSGNDYTQYMTHNPDATLSDELALARNIVGAIGENVRNLYTLGFRNFAMLTLPPFECFPAYTGQNGTSCNTQPGTLDGYQNALLLALLDSLHTNLTHARFVELDLVKSFEYVIHNPHLFGITHPLEACCAPLPAHPTNFCGDYDARRNPLFSLCRHPAHFFWWDLLHPTDAGWKAVIDLFYSGLNFTALSPNLLVWLNSLDLASGKPHPEAYDEASLAGLQSLAPHYPHLFHVLGSSGALSYLPSAVSKVGPLTLFLPSEEAVERQVGPVVEAWHKRPAVTAHLALLQLVYGWWPAERLAQLRDGHTLRSLAGSKVRVSKQDGSIFLATAGHKVAILQPAVFAAKGALLVHTTSALLLPS